MRMLVYEIAVFLWEAMRLRRYKTVTIEQARLDAAMEVAREFLGDVDPKSAADLLKDGTPLRQKLLAALAERHLSIDDVIDGRAYHDTANINDKIEAQLRRFMRDEARFSVSMRPTASAQFAKSPITSSTSTPRKT